MPAPEISVAAEGPGRLPAARRLAADLGLPLHDRTHAPPLVLLCTEQGLALEYREKGRACFRVRVDFNDPGAVYRFRQQKKELLVRAVGCRPGQPLTVIDGTGGLGRDCFLLARAGCRCRVYERQPIIARLLRDGLERACRFPDTAPAAGRIRLLERDVVQDLENMAAGNNPVDVIYLDPMFPPRRKSAGVKKESRILQLLAREEENPARLLRAARQACSRRVVVKRPRLAPPLAGSPPAHTLQGKAIRFDVYLVSGK